MGEESDSDDEEVESCWNALCSGFKLCSGNCELGKVLLASGLQMASVALPETFVFALLRARIWGNNMSSYMAYAAIGINSVAVIFGGPFGRFSDCVDRRLAAAVFAIGTFAPTWSLLIFGHTTAKALWISTVIKVVGSYGLTSNVMLALINDVTPAEDREEAVGAYYAANNLMSLTMTGIPVLLVLILRVVPNVPTIFLIAQVVLSGLCLLLLSSVRIKSNERPEQEDGSSDSESGLVKSQRLCCKPSAAREVPQSGSCVSAMSHRMRRIARQFIMPVRLACGNRRLRRLWCCGFMLM
ncbi:unnamed protein product, partial [Effrenium voratum]